MTTLRPPSAIRAVLAPTLVAALLCCASGSAVAAAESDPSTTQADDAARAQERLDADRALAAATAERITSAEAEQADLEAAIAKSEAAIPVLRTRANELRATVRERAARLYMRLTTPRLDAAVAVAHVVDAERATHLTAAIGEHDISAAATLQDMARTLEERQAQLRAQRAELEETLASLVRLQETLESRLQRAVSAYRAVRRVTAPTGSTESAIGADDAVWLTFRECTFSFESGGNYQIVSRDGLYYGAWQFAIGTWNAVAARMGRDDLVGVLPSDASPADQDAVAHALWLESGNRPWGGRC